jgi:hypothetical protein
MSQVVTHPRLFLCTAERVEKSPQTFECLGPNMFSKVSLDATGRGSLCGEVVAGPRAESDHLLPLVP